MNTPKPPNGSQQRPSPAIDPDIDVVAIPRPANEMNGIKPLEKSYIKINAPKQ